MRSQVSIARNIRAGSHVELFLVSAVSSVLFIRLYLKLSHYPQLGNESLHIAHMLWGGLLMLAALLVALNFLGRNTLVVTSVMGGIGFGMFVDEMGKYITHDNNYFYRPAVALIYSIFIALFLLLRTIQTFKNFHEREFLANVLRELETLGNKKLDADDKKRLLFYLENCDPSNEMVRRIKTLVEGLDTRPHKQPHFFLRIRRRVRDGYYKIAHLPGFRTALVMLFLTDLGIKAAQTSLLVWRKNVQLPIGAVDWVQLGSSWISGFFVLVGMVKMKRSRYEAYKMFEYAVFVSICLTQIFTFYKDQFYALSGLTLDILLIILLRYMIARERPTSERIP
jgi:hypothetical protein